MDSYTEFKHVDRESGVEISICIENGKPLDFYVDSFKHFLLAITFQPATIAKYFVED